MNESLYPKNNSDERPRRGVVAVVFRDERLLIIRRSMTVRAPGLICLPGGGIEIGETEREALIREMQEELAIDVKPVRECWRSVTRWGTELSWWLSELDEQVQPTANPEEVAEVFWMTADEIRNLPDMLPSLPEFLSAVERGEIELDQSF